MGKKKNSKAQKKDCKNEVTNMFKKQTREEKLREKEASKAMTSLGV